MRTRTRHAFTLVEILIVVVILGILAAITVPQFAHATEDTARTTTYSELQKIREHVEMFRIRHRSVLPSVAAGDGTWLDLVGPGNTLLQPPVNAWVGGNVARMVVLGAAPDPGYQQQHGWIYDPATGNVWAGGFDGNDQPYARVP